MKNLLIFLTLSLPVYSYGVVDVLGGSGLAWTSWSNTSTITGDVYKSSMTDSVFMRDNYFLGLRYSNYRDKEGGALVTGVEASASVMSPLLQGEWRYVHNDSAGKTKYESTQAATWGTVPSVNVLRASGHVGIHIPVNSAIAFELGALGGLGITKAKFRAAYPDNTNAVEDFGGIGAHLALRVAAQLFPNSGLAFGLEYRLMAEGFVTVSGILPWLYTSSGSINHTSHIFLVSLGYRFGMTPTENNKTPVKAP